MSKRKSKRVATGNGKSGCASVNGSAPGRKGKYRANFLWPHKDHSVEEAGYGFANAKTEGYQKLVWHILLKRAKAQNDKLTDAGPAASELT